MADLADHLEAAAIDQPVRALILDDAHKGRNWLQRFLGGRGVFIVDRLRDRQRWRDRW
ncbi:MAG: hypothetical protein J0H88_02740 [Sphingomonadales bacterium]|nr:hypothetical protein [Sphingomonadales bacterium]